MERALIAALVVAPEELPKAYGLRADDFADPAHGVFYRVLLDLEAAGMPAGSPLAIVNAIANRDDLPTDRRTMAYVARLASEGLAAHVTYYVSEIRRASRRRALQAFGEALLRRADDATEDVDAVQQWAEARLSNLAAMPDAIGTFAEIAAKIVADLRRPLEARKTKTIVWPGIGALNQKIGAFLGGELIVIAARPGMGKTALAMQIGMYSASFNRQSVLFVSLEMKQTELVMRVLTATVGDCAKRFRLQQETPEDVDAIAGAASGIGDIPLRVFDSAGADVTVERIRAMGRLAKSQFGLSMIVVDYLQLITPSDKRQVRQEQVADMTRKLKNMAKELDCPILCLAQLNRQAETEGRPQLSHLRESGAIEQDADTVLLLHRTGDREACCSVAKHRHAETGDVQLAWVPERTRFEDLGGPEPVDFGSSW